MKQFVIYDVSNYAWFEVVSKKLRETNVDVHEISFHLGDMPLDDWSSMVNQVWCSSVCLTQLADMVSGQVVTDGSEFILNTELTFLADAIIMLTKSQNITCQLTDWKKYK